MAEKILLTMKDIARELGVSVATVSRALKDNPRISAVQKDKIIRYAREHDFFPNLFANQLRNSRTTSTKLIGVIMPQIAHYYFSTILDGIEQRAGERGYNIMVAQSDERYEREVRICQQFHMNRVCGVIVSQAKDTTSYDHFQKLKDGGVRLVFFDRISTGMNTSRVVVDDYTGAFNAVSYLIQTGCRRIAFYGSNMRMQISQNRFNGYRDALLKNKMQPDDRLMRFCDTRAMAEEITPELLAMDDRPDAFFAVNDDTAIGVLYTAKRMGLRVPEDVSICGFTNGERAVACEPMLTTVEQRGFQVGSDAVDILVDQIENDAPSDKVDKRVVRTRLVVRGTTRQPK